MSRTEHYDLAVIGSGQGGGPLAGTFARAGKRVALIERDHVGGTCVNEGCTPTKTMIASARVAHVARRGDPYGVRTRDVEIDLPRVVARTREIVSSFRSGSENALAQAGVELIRGDARFTGARTIHIALLGKHDHQWCDSFPAPDASGTLSSARVLTLYTPPR